MLTAQRQHVVLQTPWNSHLEEEIQRYILKCKHENRIHKELSVRTNLWNNLISALNFGVPLTQVFVMSVFSIQPELDLQIITITGAALSFVAAASSRVYTYLDYSSLSRQHNDIADRFEDVGDSLRREIAYPVKYRMAPDRLLTQAQLRFMAVNNSAPRKTIELLPFFRWCCSTNETGDVSTSDLEDEESSN